MSYSIGFTMANLNSVALAWSHKVHKIIDENERFHTESLMRIQTLKAYGLTGEPWPKKPRIDVRLLDDDKNETKNQLFFPFKNYMSI